jgi:hypothetical protein
MEILATGEPLTDEEALPISKDKFCRQMKERRPSQCGVTMPRVPGYSANYRGNGCGPSTWGQNTRDFVSALAQAGIGEFSGQLDAPFPGVSFRAACDAHDACYATLAGSQAECDSQFGADMRQSCSETLSGQPFAVCDNMRAAYQSAVHLVGASAYAAGQSEAQCAQWHFEMEVNQCPK